MDSLVKNMMELLYGIKVKLIAETVLPDFNIRSIKLKNHNHKYEVAFQSKQHNDTVFAVYGGDSYWKARKAYKQTLRTLKTPNGLIHAVHSSDPEYTGKLIKVNVTDESANAKVADFSQYKSARNAND